MVYIWLQLCVPLFPFILESFKILLIQHLCTSSPSSSLQFSLSLESTIHIHCYKHEEKCRSVTWAFIRTKMVMHPAVAMESKSFTEPTAEDRRKFSWSSVRHFILFFFSLICSGVFENRFSMNFDGFFVINTFISRFIVLMWVLDGDLGGCLWWIFRIGWDPRFMGTTDKGSRRYGDSERRRIAAQRPEQWEWGGSFRRWDLCFW